MVTVCNIVLIAEAISSCAVFHSFAKTLKKNKNTSFEEEKSLEEHHLSNIALNITEKIMGSGNIRLFTIAILGLFCLNSCVVHAVSCCSYAKPMKVAYC